MSTKQIAFFVLLILVGLPLLGLITAGKNLKRLSDINPLTQSSSTAPGVAPVGTTMMYEEEGSAGGFAGNRGSGVAGMPSKDIVGRAEIARDDYATTTMIAPVDPGMMPPMYGNGDFTEGVHRLIVKDATLSMVVKDTQVAVTEITAISQKYQGYVTSVNVTESPVYYPPTIMMERDSYDYGEKAVMPMGGTTEAPDSSLKSLQGYLTLRVPADSLEAVMEEIKGLGDRVVAETLSAQDQTEQKIDLDAQIKNLRATEEQLQNLMSQAKNVEETLKVQSELTNTRGQIERLQAQVDNLEGSARLATLQVTLTTNEAGLPIVDDKEPTVWEELKMTLRSAAKFYRNLFVDGLKTIVFWGPVLIVLGGLIWWWRKRRVVKA